MLARSDRGGCATGAAAALAGDWPAIRAILARAADCFAVDLPPHTLVSDAETGTALAMLGAHPAAERAMAFWPNKGEDDPRPGLGATYRRLAPVEPKNPVVPEAAPGALRLPIVGVS